MTWPNGPTVLLLLLLVTMSVSQDEYEEPVVVETQKERNLMLQRGSPVKLSCTAEYDFERCGHVHLTWNNVDTKAELTDPRKYLTTVSETEVDSTMRRRLAVMEILDLRTEDAGGYQCVAECEKGEKEQGIGHIIRIRVRG